MKLKYLFSLLAVFATSPLIINAQDFGIGQWKDQLPYLECISVNEIGNKIYAATPYSLFYFDKDDNSINRINKINGLSDIGISSTNYSADYNTLVVAYSNANIDLIKDNRIINIPDIKRASILGNKTINTVYFIGKYAYLGCGFGIVVLDIEKEEIADTYYIGANGSQVNVLSITKAANDSLYAASEKGLYMALASSPNLANYESWRKDTRINVNGYYRNAVTFAGEIVVSMHSGNQDDYDSIYRYSGGNWIKLQLEHDNPVLKLRVSHEKLIIVNDYFLTIHDSNYTVLWGAWTYTFASPYPRDAVMDNENINWIGDNLSGLIRHNTNDGSFSRIQISGPSSAKVFSMTAFGEKVYVVPGGRDNSYVPLAISGQVYQFDNTNWSSFSPSGVNNFVTVSVDPADPARVYAGSWGGGLIEFYNGSMVKRYTESNSTLRHHSASDTGDIRVGGTCFDAEGNLWVVTSHTNNSLSKKTGDTWIPYSISIDNNDLGQIFIDQANQKWIIMRYGTMNSYPILVFSDLPEGNKFKKLNSFAGTGGIPGSTVYAVAVDKVGQVWIGTEKGIGVFYSPEDILTDSPSDAQQILVQQGVYTQYLMENEMVTAIAVDGANRKWIGTDRGGIFLVSADGTTQIYHFTEENSPLFSNRITAITISPETGDVFIGTDKGLISFRSTATEGGEKNENVYAYPNPVKDNFDGYIAIKGLVSNAEVRITDISGNLIFSTRAEGGQAIWNGKNYSGEKAKTGVYLVFANNSEGTEKVVTKILIIN